MNLFLIRHGETIENKKGLVQGWLPGHLTKKGILQAKSMKKQLKNIDIIYSSDLKRAYDTALIISDNKIKIIKTKLLRERNFGILQNNPKHNIDWNNIDDEFHGEKIEKGESITQVRTRAEKFLKLLRRKNYKNVLIVTHGFYEMILRSEILQRPLSEILRSELKHKEIIKITI